MKNKVPVALGRKTPKDLSKKHFTTLNFGETYPVYVRPVMPNQKLKIEPTVFARTAPMQLPTMSNIGMDMNCFYVPYRYVWRWFDDFITQNKSVINGNVWEFKEVPFIGEPYFYSLFFDGTDAYGQNLVEVFSSSQDGYSTCDFYDDIALLSSDDSTSKVGFKLSSQGKYIYHILTALGYNINFRWVSLLNNNIENYEHINLLPILSYFKIFYDYYLPNQLADSAPFKRLFSAINDDDGVDMRGHSADIRRCFDYCYSYYKSNYFTSAWCSPNSPTFDSDNNEIQLYNNGIHLTESERSSATVYNDEYNTSSFNQYEENNVSIQQLTFLQKFARYIKRNLLSGTRAVERIAARFGVHIDDFEYGRCRYYGSSSTQLHRMEVVGTADNNLGEYAGKAWFNQEKNKTFTIDCDHFGIVIIMAKLTTPTQFVDGIRRHNLYRYATDFYTPEFDGSIMQATSGAELYGRCPIHNNSWFDYLSKRGLTINSVYGYMPRYSECKVDIDDVTGDFALPRYSASIDSFILPRRVLNNIDALLEYTSDEVTPADKAPMYYDYTAPYGSGTNNRIDPLEVIRQTDAYQFNRIFKDIDGIVDPFWCAFAFDVVSIDGTLPLDESHELQGKGKDMYFEANGVNL